MNTWGRVANTRSLTNFVFTDVQWDAAMALSWDDTLPAGGQATYSYMAGFSPSGDIPPNPLTPEAAARGAAARDPRSARTRPSAAASRPGEHDHRARHGVHRPERRCGRHPRPLPSHRLKQTACVRYRDPSRPSAARVRARRGGVAELTLRLTDAQRARLRRDCESSAIFRAVVYQPPGRRARVVRRIVRVLCAQLRRQVCSAQAANVFSGPPAAGAAASPGPGARARRLLNAPPERRRPP